MANFHLDYLSVMLVGKYAVVQHVSMPVFSRNTRHGKMTISDAQSERAERAVGAKHPRALL